MSMLTLTLTWFEYPKSSKETFFCHTRMNQSNWNNNRNKNKMSMTFQRSPSNVGHVRRIVWDQHKPKANFVKILLQPTRLAKKRKKWATKNAKKDPIKMSTVENLYKMVSVYFCPNIEIIPRVNCCLLLLYFQWKMKR